MLLHGFGEDAAGWLPLVPALAERYEVFLLDLPGFGAAPPLPDGVLPTSGAFAEAVAGELDRLGVAFPQAAGYLVGGSGWSWLAAAGPGRWWRSPQRHRHAARAGLPGGAVPHQASRRAGLAAAR